MKVLIVQETDWLRRYSHQQHHLAEILSLRGHEIRVVDYELLWKTQGKRELRSRREVFKDVTKMYEGAKVTVVRPGIIKLPLLDYVSLVFSHRREIARQIAEFRPDVIVGFGILNSYLAARMTRKSTIPFVYYWMDVLHTLIPAKPLRAVGKVVEREALKRADRVLANCQGLKDYVIGMGAPHEKTEVVSQGIDLDRFDPNIGGDSVRDKLGINKEDLVMFFMGWLYRFSGLREVALELGRTGNTNMKLLVVGKGDLYRELEEMSRRPDLQGRLIVLGERPYREIPSFVAAADVCLLPAYTNEEIMQHIVPIKVYEYMAMGKPVVSTRLPGVVKEFGEENGVVYVERPEDAVTAAVQMVKDGKAVGLGSNARRFAERHDWGVIASEFERILKGVVEEKRNR